MKPHAIVAEGPVIACMSISLGHNALGTKSFEACCERNGTVMEDHLAWKQLEGLFSYAFPPPMMKTSVSTSSSPSSCLPGDGSRLSSSFWISKS